MPVSRSAQRHVLSRRVRRLTPKRALLLGAILFSWSAAAFAQDASGSQGANPYAGSVPATATPGVLPLSMLDAINQGLRQNLGVLLSNANTELARGERWEELSALLPHATAEPLIDASKVNLAEEGLSSLPIPGLTLPRSIGPFSYFDARANVTQTIFDWQSISNVRAAGQSVKSSEFSYQDARDLVVLAVGLTYLQAIADEARIESTEAQANAAQAVYDQASDQVKAGTSAPIDGLRTKVEWQTRQQEFIQATTDFAVEKLVLARAIGLPPGQEFELTDKSPYQPIEGMTVEAALTRAYASRADYQAALADQRAAAYSRQAAVAGYFPSLNFSADYGIGGEHPSTETTVGDVRGTLIIPIFEGGVVHGDILVADAKLKQSRERLDNLRAQIDADVRTALLNLQSSTDLVEVARSNVDLADQTLAQSRDRFSAGVADSVEVVQSEEAVASAHDQYIDSLFNDDSAKLSLVRAMGMAEEGVKEYFKGQ
ncbi:MAG: TolC family protein [Candidatus Acidiferrales bacterium]